MNTKWIIVTVAVVGCLLMISGWASAGFSIGNLFADKSVYTQVNKTENIASGDTVEIETDVEKVIVGRSSDGMAHISYFDSEKMKHVYSYNAGVLSLKKDENRKWYDNINFNFSFNEKVIEVLLPQAFNGTVNIREATGKVEAGDLTGLKRIDFTLTTGDVSVSNCEAKDARLATTTGRLSASGLTAGTLYAESTTGAIALENVSGETLTARFATGSVSLSNIDFDTVDVRGTTGGIKLTDVIANDITLRSSTGSISGNIACSAKEFTIDSSTATGNNNLQNVNYGGKRKLSVGSTTGNIKITFAE